ncbi:MAG: glutamate ABC transporter substrate-binding protein [Mycobacteriaceae bacterium]|nr:glutamate ABC transporter substrate-binding protein [Mycobacteriaceae bacterium]
MRLRPFRLAAALALLLVFVLSGCGGNARRLAIGVKFDEPGLSVKQPDGSMTGFDIDVAKYVAEQLGYKLDQIEWKEAPTGQREALIQDGQVTYLVSTYSITPERKQKVGFAGPYFQTGQSLLVREDDTDIVGPQSLTGNKRVCSVTGSTPAQRIKDKYPDVQLQLYDTYSACVEALTNGTVEAVSTDAVILAGFAAQNPGKMKIVGQPFSRELYGIGLAKENNELRGKIDDALQKMIDSGQWQAAFDKNLGPSGYKPPPPPRIERY